MKRMLMGLALALAVMVPYQAWAGAGPAPVDLGSAASFALLAGAGITIVATGPTTITGDVGTYPTLAITGLENVTLNGTNHAGDAVTQNAKNDLGTAYANAAGRSATTNFGPIYDLGGNR